MEPNPYAVSSASGFGTVPDTSAEAIRRKFLPHETSLKSVSLLYFLGGFLGLILAPIYFVAGLSSISDFANLRPEELISGVLLLILAVVVFPLTLLQLWVAWGLRKLNPRVRIGVGIVAGFGLLGFPIGTLISAYILWLTFSKKGSYVFSPEYQRIMAETPHIKYKTHLLVVILLCILLAIILFGVIAFIASAFT